MAARGRPKASHPLSAVTLRLDPRAVAAWQRGGKDWRSKMAERLEQGVWVRRQPAAPTPGHESDPVPDREAPAPVPYTLMLGDSRRVDLPPFDALITDPPYGMHYQSRHRERQDRSSPWARHIHGSSFAPIAGDDAPFDPQRWLDLAAGKPIVLWGANYFADRLPASGHWLVWDKREATHSNDQADCEMAWSNLPGGPRLFHHLWIGLCRRGEENLSRGGRKLHPNQKPVALMNWVLDQCHLKPGGTVLDPYMGSGSLGVACIRRGLRYVGVEIDETYFRIAQQRLAAECAWAASGVSAPPHP